MLEYRSNATYDVAFSDPDRLRSEKMKNHVIRCLKTLACLPRYPDTIATAEIDRKLRDEGFAVSRRTLQRDLEDLSATFPIGSEHQGRGLTWFWSSDATLFSIPAMDVDTALTFLLAEANMKDLFPVNVGSRMRPHFNAAREVLMKQDRRHLKNWKEKVRFFPRGQPLMPARIRPEVLRNVHEALLRDRRLRARYRRRGESRSKEREINPLALIYTYGPAYLVCTFRNHTEVLHLPLHRFSTARLLDAPAFGPPGFDLEEYLTRERALEYPVGGEMRLDALYDPDVVIHLRETPLSRDQRLRDHPDGRVRLTATVRDTEQLRWWLLGFGEWVEVLGPEELRREFAEIASRMRRQYLRRKP